jgi:hypothetical protein
LILLSLSFVLFDFGMYVFDKKLLFIMDLVLFCLMRPAFAALRRDKTARQGNVKRDTSRAWRIEGHAGTSRVGDRRSGCGAKPRPSGPLAQLMQFICMPQL